MPGCKLPGMNKGMDPRSPEEALHPSERDELLALVDQLGEREAARHLCVSRQTLGRAIAGLALQRGTINLVRDRLCSGRGAQ